MRFPRRWAIVEVYPAYPGRPDHRRIIARRFTHRGAIRARDAWQHDVDQLDLSRVVRATLRCEIMSPCPRTHASAAHTAAG